MTTLVYVVKGCVDVRSGSDPLRVFILLVCVDQLEDQILRGALRFQPQPEGTYVTRVYR